MGFIGKGYSEGFARRTAVNLTFDGVDITTDAAMDLLSVSYTDTESETDDLEIRLQDRNGIWLRQWLTSISDTLGLTVSAEFVYYNGRGGSASLQTGNFEIDSVSASGGSSGSSVTVRATSLPYGTAIRKTEKTKTWENYNLQSIAAEIASGGGLTLVYESSNIPEYELAEQDDETDVEFLERLCEAAGLTLKFSDEQMVIYDIADYEAADAVRTVTYQDGTYTDYEFETNEAETAYTSVEIRYTDPVTGTVYDEIYIDDASSDEDEETANRLIVSSEKVTSAADAQEKAKQLCRKHNQMQRTAQFTVPGDVNAVAGLCWQLENFGMFSGKYIITSATHTRESSSGYKTEVSLRMCS